jgi:hypothetical protein
VRRLFVSLAASVALAGAAGASAVVSTPVEGSADVVVAAVRSGGSGSLCTSPSWRSGATNTQSWMYCGGR